MKKKLLTVTVGVCLMVALVGCGAKETATVGSESKANNSEVGAVVSDIASDAVDAAIAAVESTTEYGTEETTETVVEEQATETTETVEETVTEETTEEVAEAVAFLDESIDWPEGYPKVFINDDPRTSEVADLQSLLGDADMRMYVWASDETPMIAMYPTTENYETVEEAVTLDIEGVESFATVSTDEGEKEVILVTTANDDGTVSYEYVYTLGSCTIKVDDTVSHCVEAAEDLQYFVDLIRFE